VIIEERLGEGPQRNPGERDQHFSSVQKKGPEGLKVYKQEKNRRSIDGLPGLAE
jgi:hypothetical protein